ncbi:5-formyltetrahydrofolate cyclo-ligase [Candidatus Odyssella acanthamoebae]|uniref:5-formyltetrahydrofolate cyclo-ligase n=1 Tax=Candidatus Odyssella acanthamoebae TaxID=91604 RepID=UPI000691E1EE|nr:5-formyltetrahydrofolate cyclo-ligase [Candidatus Paracaedibacter acanthamoebae]
MGLKTIKQDLRILLRRRRRDYHATIDQADIDQKLIKQWQDLSILIRLQPSQIIAGYVPLASELNILALMTSLHNQGHTMCVPQVTPAGQLNFISWSPVPSDTLESTHTQPTCSRDAPLKPALALVPLLGFDAQGNRLGQGKGYYDRSLNNIIAIGVGYNCQQLDNIPVCDKDYPMDYILTPEKIFTINKDSK